MFVSLKAFKFLMEKKILLIIKIKIDLKWKKNICSLTIHSYLQTVYERLILYYC